jgi:hypothetical protein
MRTDPMFRKSTALLQLRIERMVFLDYTYFVKCIGWWAQIRM